MTPFIIGGDFNIIWTCIEHDRATIIVRSVKMLNAIIRYKELKELDLAGRSFIWPNNHEHLVFEALIHSGRVGFPLSFPEVYLELSLSIML